MQYPEISRELVALVHQDQEDVITHSKLFKTQPTKEVLETSLEKVRINAENRISRVLEIIEKIGTPTEAKIGWKGVEAITVIALHAKHSQMKKVLASLQNARDGEIDKSLLPALIDRVRILDGKKQLFGTQWFMGYRENPYLYPVENFVGMNQLRTNYGLDKARRPRDLSDENSPENPPLATESDQHTPSKEEIDHDLDSLYG